MSYSLQQQAVLMSFKKNCLEDEEPDELVKEYQRVRDATSMRELWLAHREILGDPESTAEYLKYHLNWHDSPDLYTSVAALVVLFPQEGWELRDFTDWK